MNSGRLKTLVVTLFRSGYPTTVGYNSGSGQWIVKGGKSSGERRGLNLRAVFGIDVGIMKIDTGKVTLKDLNHLINYVWEENVFTDNCKHFAKRIFDKIAET